MTSPIDIRPDHLEIVQGILREHLPVDVKVWVFGSRTNWTTKDSSDLDIALDGENKLSHKVLGALKDAFEDSTLPYTVDVVDLHAVSPDFKKIVEEQRVALPSVRASERVEGAWREVVLGDVCTKIGSGATPRGGRDVYLEEGLYTLIRSQNVYNDGFHRDGLAFIGERHADELQNVKVFQGDVLLNITGDSVARVCQVAPDVLPARVNQHVAIIRPDSVNLDAGYLRYCLVSPEMQTLLLSWAGSGGTRNALTKGMIESLEIPLPALSEQRAIARVLGTLDDKIELNRRMNETLEAMARALYKSWFVDFDPVWAKMDGHWRPGESLPGLPAHLYDLFPDRLVDSELGPIPEGWEVKALEDLCTLRAGSVFRRGSQGKLSGKYPFIKVSDMNLTRNSFAMLDAVNWVDDDDLGELNAKPFPTGTTVFAKIGEGLKQNRIRTLVRPTLIDNNMMGAIPKTSVIAPLKLFYTLSQFDFGEVSNGTALPYLTARALYSLRVSVPRLAEQTLLIEPLQSIYKSLVSNETESRSLAAQRDSLLPRLVSGEVGVVEFS